MSRNHRTALTAVWLLLGCASACFPVAQRESLPDAGTGATSPPAREGGRGEPAHSGFRPAYVSLHESGELKRRAEMLWAVMEKCALCPRNCGANRLEGQTGFCQSKGTVLHVSAAHPHFGEEKPLVGTGGSGTIFFTNCSLRCSFCQNWEISHRGIGTAVSVQELAARMLELQRIGCHNINLVTPTHYAPHIVKAIDIAAGRGLRLPIVYNTSGWERIEVLKILDGIIDIYMPDFKYWDSAMAAKYSSGAASYPQITKLAILEMNRQVGVARPAEDGLIYRGLIIRHLVMPENVAGSLEIMDWIAAKLPKDTYVNIMAQYRPMYKAYDFPEISRMITAQEYIAVVERARKAGLTNLDVQGFWWLD